MLTDLPADRDIRLTVDGEEEGEWGLVWATDAEGSWERSRSMSFSPPAGASEVWVGLVNLDHANYARSASLQALKAGQQQISLEIELPEPQEPQDTGDTGDTVDTGVEDPPAESGCGGCSGTGGVGAWWLLSGLLLLRRRRSQ